MGSVECRQIHVHVYVNIISAISISNLEMKFLDLIFNFMYR